MTEHDQQQLRLLAIAHYIGGGLLALCAFTPIIHFVVGIILLVNPPEEMTGDPLHKIGSWIFVLFSSCVMIAGWALAGSMIAAGTRLRKRKNYDFCIFVAGAECLFMPVGTVLGVFTIVVLMRPAVKKAFGYYEGRPLPPD